MTYTSARPITVDGVRLDTLAWNITRLTRVTAQRRTNDVTLPGIDGVAASLNDGLEPAMFALEMFVRGTDADGAVPGSGSLTTYRNNLDELVHLFGKRHALLDVQEQVDGTGTLRRAWCKVTDALVPDQNSTGDAGVFTVGMAVPSGVWEDVNTADWTSGTITSGVAQEVTTLQGATERVSDAVVLVTGPVTNPTLTDPATGAYVTLNATLSGTQFWRVNMATWSSRYGTGLGLGSADTTGTDGQALTTYGGLTRTAAFLPLTPVRDTGARRVKVSLTGTGITTASRVSVRARRKWAL